MGRESSPPPSSDAAPARLRDLTPEQFRERMVGRRVAQLSSALDLDATQQERLSAAFLDYGRKFREIQRKILDGEIVGDIQRLPELEQLHAERETAVREILTGDQYRRYRQRLAGSAAASRGTGDGK
jgi:hypothetical protein